MCSRWAYPETSLPCSPIRRPGAHCAALRQGCARRRRYEYKMKRGPSVKRTSGRVFAIGLIAALSTMAAAQPEPPRRQLGSDSTWKFLLGDPQSAEARTFDDASWRTVDLPHDWSIEGKADKDNPSGSGGGFFPAGAGWYRKAFAAPPAWKGKRVSVEFDGVYMNATVFLNGHKLGVQPYG